MTSGRHPAAENRTYGAARDLASAPLPVSLQSLGQTALERLGRHRDSEFRRAFWDLLTTLGESEDESWTTDRLRALIGNARLTHELVGYLDDLTYHVHDGVRPAYLRFAADALSGLLPPALERDVGFLLRRLPTSDARILRWLILHETTSLPSDPSDEVATGRVLSRLVDAGFASRRPPPISADDAVPEWLFVYEEGRRAALERYAALLRGPDS